MDGTSTVLTNTPEPSPARAKVKRGRERFMDRNAPVRWFHVFLFVATMPLLWAASSPAGGTLLWSAASLGVLSIGALVWAAWLINWFAGRRWDHPRPSGRRFLIAPLCACIFGGLIFINAPLWARWNQAQPTLERIAADAPPARTDGRPLEFDVPDNAGTYRLDHGVRVDDDVFIFLTRTSGGSSGFLVGSGFAYLPDGPDPARADPVTGVDPSRTALVTGAERTALSHLTGNWYAWASYW